MRFRTLNSPFSPIKIPWLEKKSTQPALRTNWPNDMELLRWTEDRKDIWTLEDALRGTQIFGATGSGKTSGSGRKIANAFLKAGFGGLVVCVKQDEADLWEKLCKENGREEDFVRIAPGSQYKYNFLDAEAKAEPEALILNVSDFFTEIIETINRSNAPVGKDTFWTDALARMLNNSFVLENAAYGHITVRGQVEIITSAVATSGSLPKLNNTGGVQTEAISYLRTKKKILEENTLSEEVRQALEYFDNEFSELAEKTRSIVVSMFTSMADTLGRSPLKELLCSETAITPSSTFEGKILVIDLPIHRFQKVGKIANLVWKKAFQRACLRRKNPKRPVFLWEDESQYLLDRDAKFQTTARSTKCCTVNLTQSIQNYISEIGNKATVMSYLASLHNKIFHQNSDVETNRFASETIGKIRKASRSFTIASSWLESKKTATESLQWDYDVPPRKFLNLKNGGSLNDCKVSGIVAFSGKKLSTDKAWLHATFLQ